MTIDEADMGERVSNGPVISITEDMTANRNTIGGNGFLRYRTGHCHDGVPSGNRLNKAARRKLVIALCFCAVFLIIEVVGGFLSGSIAILTDAAHLSTDCMGFSLNLIALHIGSRPPSKKYTFGWYRAEVLGAMLSVILIWAMTCVLCYNAILRLFNTEFEIDGQIMLINASLAVVVNLIIGLTLSDIGKSHKETNGKDENMPLLDVKGEAEVKSQKQPESSPGKKAPAGSEANQNINVRMAFIHVLGDMLQSLAVLVAAILIYVNPDYKIADPICTFTFSLLVLTTTIIILRDLLRVLMEGIPHDVDYDKVKDAIFKVKGVRDLHDLRLWSLTSGKTCLCVHVVCSDESDLHQVALLTNTQMREEFGLNDVTVQVERYHSSMAMCDSCLGPLK